MKIQDV
ncbi:hypothetical protein ECPA33_3732, partial [Escherichia coli PA33]